MTAPAGRAAWELARARALNPRPADPQANVIGGPAATAAAADLMTPCATPLPGGGTCAAPKAEHHLTGSSGAHPRGRRTYCTRQEGPRHCPCDEFTPPTEARSTTDGT